MNYFNAKINVKLRTCFKFLSAIAILFAFACEPLPKEDPVLSLAVKELPFLAKGGEMEVPLTANAAWQATGAADWCSITPTSGTENATIKVTVELNEGEQRETKFVFSMGELKQELKIVQAEAVFGCLI